jgi:hypothetical protein
MLRFLKRAGFDFAFAVLLFFMRPQLSNLSTFKCGLCIPRASPGHSFFLSPLATRHPSLATPYSSWQLHGALLHSNSPPKH